jgi:hypothetical protein
MKGIHEDSEMALLFVPVAIALEFLGAIVDLRRDVPKLIALAAATGRE